MAPHRKPQTVQAEARTMLKRIAEKCDEEALKGDLLYALHMPTTRAAEYTGLSSRTVGRIRKESLTFEEENLPSRCKKRQRSIEKGFQCSPENKTVIRNIISDFYIEKKISPTALELLAAIRKEIDFPPSLRVLRKVLHNMGFKWKRSSSKRVLIEKPNIVVRRGMFLRALHNYWAENRNVVYIGGTWVDTTFTFRKFCQSEEQLQSKEQNTSSSDRLIILHAGNKDGFVPNAALILKSPSTSDDYQREMCAIVETWVVEKLLPNIPERTVVVMGNASYQSVELNKPPSKYARKTKMIDWLVQHNVRHSDTMKKYELIQLIARHKPQAKIYKIDEIIKSSGHSVLRLPPNMCELNPIELAWAEVMRKIEENDKSSVTLERLRSLIEQTIDAVTATEWKSFCERTEEIQHKYWEKDNMLELAMENLTLDIEDTDSAEDLDGSSSSEDL